MRIALFHPKVLPPRDYGGVERVVVWLARGLVELGHEVWIGALKGSELPRGARLIPIDAERSSAWDFLPQLPAGVDVVHWMAPPEAGVSERLPCAGILTVHGNGKPGERFPLNTVFLSQDHASRHGAQVYVHNGVDPDECRFNPRARKERGLVFLSKTTWSVKNLRGAQRIAGQSGARLEIAGGNRPLGARIRAALHPRMRWLGPVGGEGKRRALSEAGALLFPILWPEPFGLVVVEALLSGTPVIGSRLGSLPEIVTPETGMLLDAPRDTAAEKAWVDAIRAWRGDAGVRWRPEACRERALREFHYLKMAEGYVSAYKQVIAGQSLNPTAPVAGDWRMET